MTKEIELAKQHGILYRLTPEGTTEMWCHDRSLQAFAEALVAAERERCAKLCESFGCPQDRVAFADGFNAAKDACAYWIRLGPNVQHERTPTARTGD